MKRELKTKNSIYQIKKGRLNQTFWFERRVIDQLLEFDKGFKEAIEDHDMEGFKDNLNRFKKYIEFLELDEKDSVEVRPRIFVVKDKDGGYIRGIFDTEEKARKCLEGTRERGWETIIQEQEVN